MEGPKSWDRPVVLRGADGILARHSHRHPQTDDFDGGANDFQSPYTVMEDMDLTDRLCVQDGSPGHPAYNWYGAWHDGKQELAVHFREYWRDILDDDESSRLEKFLLICEFPMTVCRKVSLALSSVLKQDISGKWQVSEIMMLTAFISRPSSF